MERSSSSPRAALERLNERIVACQLCPRLRAHGERTALEKRAAYRDQTYWGRPVPNLLDESRQGPPLVIVGLAPAAHGANRTGRMFTGDRSGDVLFRALYEAGLASQPTATGPGDGLKLHGIAVAAACHCAPPANKPTREELANCRPHLEQTLEAMPRLAGVIALGRVGHDAVMRFYKGRGQVRALADHPFSHAAEHPIPRGPTVIDSYHPSQQNTFTGRLTPAMLEAIFQRARRIGGMAL